MKEYVAGKKTRSPTHILGSSPDPNIEFAGRTSAVLGPKLWIWSRPAHLQTASQLTVLKTHLETLLFGLAFYT